MTAGGVWASVPAPTVALAIVDVIRRPGASQYALDHARLLGPLGAIPDAGRAARLLIGDLVDDLLAPLGQRRDPGRAARRPVGRQRRSSTPAAA